MVNRSCDFCENTYKKNPSYGYYSVTDKMRLSLQLGETELAEYSFICGEHFVDQCFDENGRLRRESIPTMFPRRECLNHDHNYTKTEDEVGAETGKLSFIYIFFYNLKKINYYFGKL